MLKPLWCCEEYLVSDNGFILCKNGKDKLKPSLNHGGYCIVNLMIHGNRVGMAVHTAIAMTFLYESYRKGLTVNHIDGNKQNNKVSNLEWITMKDNVIHSVKVLGKHIGINNGNAKKVFSKNISTGEINEFNCIMGCAKAIKQELNLNTKERYVQNSIVRVLKGIRNSYHNYIFSYTTPKI